MLPGASGGGHGQGGGGRAVVFAVEFPAVPLPDPGGAQPQGGGALRLVDVFVAAVEFVEFPVPGHAGRTGSVEVAAVSA